VPCNCGGSQQRDPQLRREPAVQREVRQGQAAPARRGGGPGSPDYYWSGPDRPLNGPTQVSSAHNGPPKP
jgi:hypothetical protein